MLQSARERNTIFTLLFCVFVLHCSFFTYNSATNTKLSNRYFINASKVDSIINNSDKSYTLIYLYAYWCKPCREKTPKIIELAKGNSDMKVIFVNTDREKDYENNERYLSSIDFSFDSYTASEEYGKGRKRLSNFIEAICPTCQSNKMGYSSSILYNKDGKVIFSSTYETTNMIEQIRTHIFN